MPRDIKTLFRNDEGFVTLMRTYIETSPDKHKTIADIKNILDTIAISKKYDPVTGKEIDTKSPPYPP